MRVLQLGEVAPDDAVERFVTEQREVAIAEMAPVGSSRSRRSTMPVLREIGLVTMELERTRVALIAQLPGPHPAFEQEPGSICLEHDMVPKRPRLGSSIAVVSKRSVSAMACSRAPTNWSKSTVWSRSDISGVLCAGARGFRDTRFRPGWGRASAFRSGSIGDQCAGSERARKPALWPPGTYDRRPAIAPTAVRRG
jgi:hypothetical protein